MSRMKNNTALALAAWFMLLALFITTGTAHSVSLAKYSLQIYWFISLYSWNFDMPPKMLFILTSRVPDTVTPLKLGHQSCSSAVSMLASPHSFFLILIMDAKDFISACQCCWLVQYPKVTSGHAWCGWQLLPTRPTAVSTLNLGDILRPVHRSWTYRWYRINLGNILRPVPVHRSWTLWLSE